MVFARNFGLSIATVFIIVMVIFLITFLFIFNFASDALIANIQEKVDVSVYLKEDVSIDNILSVKADLAKIPEIKDIKYVSKEEVLAQFIEKHKNDPVLMESLAEVGENPFLATLNIKAWQASQFEQVSKFLENYGKKDLIEKIDYYERKPVIDKIFSVTSGVNRAGIISGIVLAVIAILVALNTIRITICSLSEEIKTMRLVGASGWFIRGPFLIQGAVAGVLATLTAFLISFGLSYILDPKIKTIAPDISSFGLFMKNFWNLFLIQLLTGIGLGVIASGIAVRRYLKI